MNTAQLQLDYPVWRLSWSAYGEQKGYDLSQTESATDWFDHDRSYDREDIEACYTLGEYETDAERNA